MIWKFLILFKSCPRLTRRRELGTTLAEVLVALGIVGVVAVGMSQFYGQSQVYKRKLRIRAVMESLAEDISNKIRSPSAIYLSTLDEDNNRNLIKCLIGALDGCTPDLIQYNPDNPNEFALLYPTKKDAYDQITSGPRGEIFYDVNGNKCKNKKDSLCAFEAQTFFFATCPKQGGLAVASTCINGASEIHVAYQVRQIPGTLKEFGKALPSLPSVIQFSTMTAEKIFGPSYNSDCNLGAVIVGYDRTGRATCKCGPPYVDKIEPPLSNRRGPLCRKTIAAELSCPEGLVFRGLKGDGTPDCKVFKEAYECIAIKGQQAQEMGTCGTRDYADYWIAVNEKSDCEFHCTIAKGGGLCESDEEIGSPPPPSYLITKQTNDGSAIQVREGLICKNRLIRCCRPK